MIRYLFIEIIAIYSKNEKRKCNYVVFRNHQVYYDIVEVSFQIRLVRKLDFGFVQFRYLFTPFRKSFGLAIAIQKLELV